MRVIGREEAIERLHRRCSLAGTVIDMGRALGSERGMSWPSCAAGQCDAGVLCYRVTSLGAARSKAATEPPRTDKRISTEQGSDMSFYVFIHLKNLEIVSLQYP